MQSSFVGITMQALLVLSVQEGQVGSKHPIDLLLLFHDGPFSVAWLGDLLRSEEVGTRSEAATGLIRLGPDAEAALSPLRQALKDDDDHVRRYALIAISNCGRRAWGALHEVTVLLDDQNYLVRGDAARAVANLAPDSPYIARKLLQILKHDPEIGVRIEAAQAIAEMGAVARIATRGLSDIAQLDESAPTVDIDDNVQPGETDLRIEAAAALCRIIHDPRAVPWLIAIVQDKQTHWYLRERAVIALGAIGKDSAQAVPVLCEAVRCGQSGTETELGDTALQALARIGQCPDTTLPVLLPLVADPATNGNYKVGALWALEAVGKIRPGTKAAQQCLEEALTYRDPRSRLVAAGSMVSMGLQSTEVARVLVDILRTQSNPRFYGFQSKLDAVSMRRDAAKILGEMGTAARVALPALLKAREDEFQSVREASEEALKRIYAASEKSAR